MRKVELRMNEENKYMIIKKLVETNGNKKRAAIKLGCSTRTINRLIIKYKTQGKAAFVHGNRGRLPSKTIPLGIKNKIIKLYIDEFSDANFTHFCEIIYEDYNIKISDTTLNKWLREENIISPKARKKTKKLLKKALNAKLNDTKSKKIKDDIKETIIFIDSKDAHPRRPRCKYMGEMIQMDASCYMWVNGKIWHLHLAIDDATGEVVGAYFDVQETLNGYYNVLFQILLNYGIPAIFYTDRRTVFEYKRKNNAFDDDDTFTQFSYACHNLGVDIKTTSVAQAKGRIERLNQTFQSRLPIELKRAQITTIEQANEFLKSYPNSKADRLAFIQIKKSSVKELGTNEEYELKSSTFEALPYAFKDYTEDKNEHYYHLLGLIGAKREWKYIEKKYMSPRYPNKNNIDKYKVFIPKANGSGFLGETLSKSEIGRPYDSATSTFISIGAFNSEEEAKNCAKYLKTKLLRCLLGILKKTQDNPPSVWGYIPLQNFTAISDIDWEQSISDIDSNTSLN